MIKYIIATWNAANPSKEIADITASGTNLTIIYDGDAAGIKAAARGLDLALEEGLIVKLVLIPDNEDPDSYVNKVGPDAFREFVQSAKKDFVLFQLEVQLKEVGGDLNKKNALVNQIAETLSKINKPEDFTKLQEYVRKCSSLLRIDETGLTQLVNKFKRDKMVKEEKKMSYDEAAILMPSFPNQQEQQEDTDLFTDKDLAHEKNLVKLIIDYGNELTKENKLVAQWIFDEIESFPLENEDMVYLIEAYKKWFYAGKLPNAKTLQYHEDERVQKWVVSLFEPDHELSQRWNEKLGKPERVEEKDIINEIEIGLMYFKLRKVKKMISQNQIDLEAAPEKEQIQLLQIHKHLKDVERELTQGIGTVILK